MSSVKITGGSNGQYLQTNGSGNLSWVTLPTTGTGITNGTSNISIPVANGAILSYVGGKPAGILETNKTVLGYFGDTTATFGNNSVVVGPYTSNVTTGNNTVIIGSGASRSPNDGGIAIGANAVGTHGQNAVVIGAGAAGAAGAGSIIIGANAVSLAQAYNIVLNASGVAVPSPASANTLQITPIRNDTSSTTNILYYNTTTKEVTYTTAPAANLANINYATESVSNQGSATSAVLAFTTAPSIVYFNQPTGNVAVNFTGVNTNQAANTTVTMAVMINQGTTARSVNSFQLDGGAQLVKWVDGSVPAAVANCVQSFTYTALKTAANTWTVLGQSTVYQ